MTAGAERLGRARRTWFIDDVPTPTARPFSAIEERIVATGARWMTRLNLWLLRTSGGRLGNRFLYGAPLLQLTTQGWKTGARGTVVLIYLRDGDRLVVVASKGGVSEHPVWYRNLTVHPDVEIELDGRTAPMRATTAAADERASLWPRLVALYPPYDGYQARTAREIPVVVLTPR